MWWVNENLFVEAGRGTDGARSRHGTGIHHPVPLAVMTSISRSRLTICSALNRLLVAAISCLFLRVVENFNSLSSWYKKRPQFTITEKDWDFFNQCYANTYHQHHSSPYLNRDFFARIGHSMSEQTLLNIAKR